MKYEFQCRIFGQINLVYFKVCLAFIQIYRHRKKGKDEEREKKIKERNKQEERKYLFPIVRMCILWFLDSSRRIWSDSQDNQSMILGA
jgi:hypothetical protein